MHLKNALKVLEFHFKRCKNPDTYDIIGVKEHVHMQNVYIIAQFEALKCNHEKFWVFFILLNFDEFYTNGKMCP